MWEGLVVAATTGSVAFIVGLITELPWRRRERESRKIKIKELMNAVVDDALNQLAELDSKSENYAVACQIIRLTTKAAIEFSDYDEKQVDRLLFDMLLQVIILKDMAD